MSEHTPNFYAIIPANVRYCKDIEMGAKLLYGEITSLTHAQGYCWATNQYFADLYDVDLRTIQRWLISLKDKKFIVIETQKNGIQWQRRIWISQEIKKVFTKGQKCHPPMTKMSPPHDKNVTHNSKSNTKEEEEVSATAAVATSLAEFLLKKIKKEKPNFTKEISPRWIKDAIRILKIRTPNDIRKVIDWAFEDHFWSTIVLSPGSILKNLDKIEMQMTKGTGPKKQSPVAVEQENKEFAKKIAQKYPNERDIIIGENYIEFNLGAMNRPHIKFGDSGFKEQVLNNLRKMRLSTEGMI